MQIIQGMVLQVLLYCTATFLGLMTNANEMDWLVHQLLNVPIQAQHLSSLHQLQMVYSCP